MSMGGATLSWCKYLRRVTTVPHGSSEWLAAEIKCGSLTLKVGWCKPLPPAYSPVSPRQTPMFAQAPRASLHPGPRAAFLCNDRATERHVMNRINLSPYSECRKMTTGP